MFLIVDFVSVSFYADIAIAAPYEGNGAVYLFYGSQHGLTSKWSQRIIAPEINGVTDYYMFGHGLSKGADIDGNNYLDLAIGAPNSEQVFIYQSYPVIRINATITPHTQTIQITDRTIKFMVCWMYEAAHPIDFNVNFHATVKIDGQLNRAKFHDNKNVFELPGNVTDSEQCMELGASVTYQSEHIFKPIELEMAYNVVEVVPRSANGLFILSSVFVFVVFYLCFVYRFL